MGLAVRKLQLAQVDLIAGHSLLACNLHPMAAMSRPAKSARENSTVLQPFVCWPASETGSTTRVSGDLP